MVCENISIWQPKFVNAFQCDGSKCNAMCCCNAWDIVIDAGTYGKYAALSVAADRERILAAIEPREEAEGYRIKFNGQHACPLLCGDKRCSVQASYGGEYLSQVCMTYPRKVIQLSTCQLRVLSMTCPVAARLALFGQGLELTRLEYQTDYCWSILEEKQAVEHPQLGGLIEALLVSCVGILQDTGYTRAERLLLLGLYLDRADELREADEPELRLAELGRFYHTEEFRHSVEGFLVDYSFLPQENGHYWQRVLQELAEKDILKAADELRQGVRVYQAGGWSQMLAVGELARALDNLLVQEFLYQGYPFRVEGSFLHNYLVFLQSFSLFEIMLAGRLERLGGMLGQAELIGLVGEYCYTADHKMEFIDYLEGMAAEHENDPIRFMQQLLRLS